MHYTCCLHINGLAMMVPSHGYPDHLMYLLLVFFLGCLEGHCVRDSSRCRHEPGGRSAVADKNVFDRVNATSTSGMTRKVGKFLSLSSQKAMLSRFY
ncbi:hypothetical protein AVEN_160144-1 [Araneus ventricosus]|uniref:Uncharacterized protein n=1 Tax=Araneus ventricosus TaxID=182803 RepID=A0A4Y2NCG9_ARAVE|nr:hypothetical protein AVEN_160144-1 [Araneus ventricosus]